MSKKVLIIFDLTKTLAYGVKNKKQTFFNEIDKLQDVKPNDSYDKGWNLYYRPFRQQMLDYLFLQNQNLYEIAVWSSLDKDKTSFLAKSFFGRYYRNLLFVSATRREEYEGLKNDYDFNPIQIKRDLNQVFLKFNNQYEQHNTIVISNFKNQLEQFRQNEIIFPQYDPQLLGPNFSIDMALSGLTKYLGGMQSFIKYKNITDVRLILNAKSYNILLERLMHNAINNYKEYN